MSLFRLPQNSVILTLLIPLQVWGELEPKEEEFIGPIKSLYFVHPCR